MANRIFRFGLLGMPLVALACGVISACSSDPDPTPAPTPDATTEAQGNDAGDAGTSDVQDGGPVIDSAQEAEASLPLLCKTYPDDPADATAAEGPRTLYQLIAVRALLEAVSSCEIGAHFPDLEDPPPSHITCLGKQLAALAGCRTGGFPTDYKTVIDENNAPCVPTVAGKDTMQLGFRNPGSSGYTVQDIDFLIALVRKAALSTGMPAADADRLKALLDAERANAADGGDGGLSQSTCP